jgi:hypothetical protein
LLSGNNQASALRPSAKPFEWTFTRSDLDVLLEKLKQKNLTV